MDSMINDINQPTAAKSDFQVRGSEKQIPDRKVTADQTQAGAAANDQIQSGKAAESQTETAYAAVSSQGDTLSISEAGKTASSENGAVLLSRPDADGTVLRKENTAETTESDSVNSTVILTGYTEYELKQLYLGGDITKIEYDEELKSRGVLE